MCTKCRLCTFFLKYKNVKLLVFAPPYCCSHFKHFKTRTLWSNGRLRLSEGQGLKKQQQKRAQFSIMWGSLYGHRKGTLTEGTLSCSIYHRGIQKGTFAAFCFSNMGEPGWRCVIDNNRFLWKDTVACLQWNDFRTGWFPTPSGMKQGDVLAIYLLFM